MLFCECVVYFIGIFLEDIIWMGFFDLVRVFKVIFFCVWLGWYKLVGGFMEYDVYGL